VSYEEMIASDELVRMWKEAIMDYLRKFLEGLSRTTTKLNQDSGPKTNPEILPI
jgi:hypothetical protein